jgi:GNAT superfamily N-acetyltransferase
LAADLNGKLAGSNLITSWGSVGFVGPLSVEPVHWYQGIAKRLMASTLDALHGAGAHHAGLFTFSGSARHLGLYQRFGFWPRILTAIMRRDLPPTTSTAAFTRLSQVAEGDRKSYVDAWTEMTGSICQGLGLTGEIRSVADQGLGDTLVLAGGARVDAFAVCITGAGSEADAGNCYVKFAAARPGIGAERRFERLLDACEALATALGAKTCEVGVSTECHHAYSMLLARGYKTGLLGVTMERPNRPAYHGPDTYVMDDWR